MPHYLYRPSGWRVLYSLPHDLEILVEYRSRTRKYRQTIDCWKDIRSTALSYYGHCLSPKFLRINYQPFLYYHTCHGGLFTVTGESYFIVLLSEYTSQHDHKPPPKVLPPTLSKRPLHPNIRDIGRVQGRFQNIALVLSCCWDASCQGDSHSCCLVVVSCTRVGSLTSGDVVSHVNLIDSNGPAMTFLSIL